MLDPGTVRSYPARTGTLLPWSISTGSRGWFPCVPSYSRTNRFTVSPSFAGMFEMCGTTWSTGAVADMSALRSVKRNKSL